ncbi:MAG: serine/threonine protein kinase [Treponema sp.]|nr:serine/threonine protein kinase [Treponema sp.]
MSDEFPPMIGKYKILGIIAKGGMGTVYKAIHPSLKRYVVIKKLTARGKSGSAERFKKEAQILLDLQSPYIVHLFDYFTEAGFRYMVEELVDGIAVDALIKKMVCIPTPIAMLIMQDACYALKYAHSKNIIHRDIKPGNILISKRGEIKLADFGIASDQETENDLTESGIALGTPSYMPPEQFEDSANVDERADIYALGVMLYEMITGTKPYKTGSLTESLANAKKGKYIKPEKLNKDVPKEVSKIIRKMIRPKPKHRYQSVKAVLNAVKKYLKHYDTHEIRVCLAKAVIVKKYVDEEIVRKDIVKRRIRKITAAVVSLGAVFLIMWQTGLIHRLVLRKIYAPVNINMTVPSSLLEQTDLPIKAFFFEDDNDKIPEIKDSSRVLFKEGSRLIDKIYTFGTKVQVRTSYDKNTVYKMRTLYLKSGNYRIKIAAGPYVWWNSFTINENVDECVLNCDFLKNMRRTLKVNFQINDAATNSKIEVPYNCEVLFNNEWKSLDSVDLEKITSGTVWKFRFTADGYKEKVYSLLIDWYQDELMICTTLERI